MSEVNRPTAMKSAKGIKSMRWLQFAACFCLPAYLQLLCCSQSFSAPSGYHQQLESLTTETGDKIKIDSPEIWGQRATQIKQGMRQVTGPLPSRENLPPLEITITETTETDHYIRQTLTFVTEPGHRLPCDLYLPKGLTPGEKRPAILALHPTGSQGKRIVAGEGPRANRQYGVELAQRGYVVICPDYPSFGDDANYDFTNDQYVSGTMKGIVNHMRCVDLLQSLDEVDGDRIGVIGHSLGGHNAIFVAFFDPRLKAIVSSCGWTPFHDYYGGKLKGWTSPRYMPLIAEKYNLDPDQVPFDFYELVAALAPRPFFSNSPIDDGNFDVAGVRKAIPKAKRIYELFDSASNLVLKTPPCDHDFPTEIRAEAYAFLDQHLKHEPTGGLDFSAELPRIPATSPAEALREFNVADGYEIQQTAAEPLVNDPVAMCFDARGRLYVVEMIGYSEQPDEHLGQVAVLEDTDQDGVFDRRTVFAKDLSWPTAIICYDGGVYVGAAPDIHYMKDTDGDLIADEESIVFTGFGTSNVQGLLNSFRWGLDNRIHGAASVSGGMVRRPDQPESAAINLRRRDFSFDPKTHEIRAENGGAQHGLCFDDWGRKFVCSNSDHLQMVMFDDRYAARNPYLKAPSPRLSIADDGGQAPVFRTSPVEPWRIVRTRLRASGVVKGVVEGGGKPAGYFTGSTGVTIYRGDAWPQADHGLAIVGDVGSNIIHRKRLSRDGIPFVGTRIDQNSELVTSTDIWFRPVQFANSPDGTLHILDMYREVIEHPRSLPPEIKQHLDLTSGRDRGRLYRVVPQGYQHRPTANLAGMSSSELVELLGHPNSWHRETAHRLLYERQDKSIINQLVDLVKESTSPLGKAHGLYVLRGLNGLTREVVVVGLNDPEPMVRVHALRMAEAFANRPEIRIAVSKLVATSSLDLNYQLAFTLGAFPPNFRNPLLAKVLASHPQDPWIRFAVLTSLPDGAATVLKLVIEQSNPSLTPARIAALEALVDLIAGQNNPAETALALATLTTSPQLTNETRDALLERFIKSLSTKGGNTALAEQKEALRDIINQILANARTTIHEQEVSLDQRISAVRSLAVSNKDSDHELLLSLVDHRQPQQIQLAAIGVLRGVTDANIQRELLAKFPALSPTVRNELQEAMLGTTSGTELLLSSILAGDLAASELNRTRLQLLLNSKDDTIAKLAKQVVSQIDQSPRAAVVKKYQSVLEMAGDVDAGRTLFRKVCAGCHRLEDHGYALGPNLATYRSRGEPAILLNILDPNREVTPDYLNYLVITTEGVTHTGMLASQNATTVTLKRAEDKETSILRIDIDTLQSSGQSLMPEGLEKDLKPQQMADLLEYLMQVK